jgi:hypothetical protein
VLLGSGYAGTRSSCLHPQCLEPDALLLAALSLLGRVVPLRRGAVDWAAGAPVAVIGFFRADPDLAAGAVFHGCKLQKSPALGPGGWVVSRAMPH